MGLGAPIDAAAPDTANIEFFEKKIRPVLVEHCYKCHSHDAEKVKGGLLLDTRDGLLKGGDSGPAIVPGDPEKSLLIKAVRYTDENLQMPPKNKKLAPEQIAHLETWVKTGAADPRSAQGPNSTNKVQSSAHWAFQPIRQRPVPAVKNKRWVETPVDAFILARLEEKKISPSPRADKRTLIRRATIDLLGLPPTPEEVSQFLADTSADAYPRLVDRLLDSPHYGERWARYWLDIARYADTKGYIFEEERRFAYAYTYRDYVIRAFSEDLPFDQFVIQQIAADLLPLGEDKRPLAALGFLTLGRRFLNNQPDIIDDRIDVVTRGTMGLTVSCARCHDHKYDPIPTKDYYSLYGVFASCSEPGEKPLLGTAALPKAYPEYLAEREKRENELKTYREIKEAETLSKLRQQVGEYLLAAHDAQKLADKGKQEALARERKLDPTVTQHWINSLEAWSKNHHPIFAPWLALAALPENEFASKAKELSAKFAANSDTNLLLNPLVAKMFSGEPAASLKELSERYGRLFSDMEKRWKEFLEGNAKAQAAEGQPKPPPPTALPDAHEEAIRQALLANDAPCNLKPDELTRLFDVPTIQRIRALGRKAEEVHAIHPGAPPRAMALQDNPTPHNPRIFLRGNANNPGAEVPRQFLEVLAGPNRKPFEKGSGRLELAQAIASTNNPLTARVIANRVWMYHFGAPLVRTPSDFGLRSEPPTHPELLDYLAALLMSPTNPQPSSPNSQHGLGWSLKKLHRLMMLSSAYQQSSQDNPAFAKIDPNNQLLWKMNRRRLDFEAMRDTLLAVAGKLDRTPGGQAVELTTEPFTTRRTVYGFIERQNLPALFRTFDFASPDTTSPQRFTTTVPQQALFLMNSPFVVQQARNLMERPELESKATVEQRVRHLYQMALQRDPTRDELRLALGFLQKPTPLAAEPPELGFWLYGYGEFDEASKQIRNFQSLPHFTGTAWQGGTNLPNEKLGWVMLNAEGGHVGNDLQHAAIRRWTAPRDGLLTINGELQHPSAKGDGVRSRIVSSRLGELGHWIASNQKTTTQVEQMEVRRGDKIDFVTDCRTEVTNDSFNWSSTIKYKTDEINYAAGVKVEWNAKSDFAGPPKEQPKPLDAWEKYAQVLLLSNELMFVD